MKILLVDDDAVARETYRAILAAQGHEVVTAENGRAAWDRWLLTRFRIIVADWLMPDMDGLELCRRIRARPPEVYTYIILVTVRSGRGNFLEAMRAGVDDFISKPVDPEELVARLVAAERILGVREELFQLEGLLAICSYCRRLRDDAGNWISLERYIEAQSGALLSHSICPDCYVKHVEPQLNP
jgi:sigma-B regulation protein RsbU (phosphoserine phosphatase)